MDLFGFKGFLGVAESYRYFGFWVPLQCSMLLGFLGKYSSHKAAHGLYLHQLLVLQVTTLRTAILEPDSEN